MMSVTPCERELFPQITIIAVQNYIFRQDFVFLR